METPTISKKQEKKALSSRKPKKGTIKNVLAKPYRNFWPTISQEDNILLKDTLEKFLPLVHIETPKIPYKEIKAIPKAERKAFRENYSKHDIEINKSEASNIVFGVNSVSNLILNRGAASVLISSEVKPRLLVQHVLDQAVLFSVPALVTDNLASILKEKCGIKSVTVAFKNTVNLESNVGMIQQCISNIAENYPVPENHINYNRRLKLCNINFNQEIIEISDYNLNLDQTIVSITDSEDNNIEPCNSNSNKIFHLTRKDNTSRVFVPETSIDTRSRLEYMEIDGSGVSGLSFDDSNKTISNNIKYVPLQVKRLKGDENRNKRKLDNFKKK